MRNKIMQTQRLAVTLCTALFIVASLSISAAAQSTPPLSAPHKVEIGETKLTVALPVGFKVLNPEPSMSWYFTRGDKQRLTIARVGTSITPDKLPRAGKKVVGTSAASAVLDLQLGPDISGKGTSGEFFENEFTGTDPATKAPSVGIARLQLSSTGIPILFVMVSAEPVNDGWLTAARAAFDTLLVTSGK